MMGLIDEAVGGKRRFGPGHFDLDRDRRGASLDLSQIWGDLRLFRQPRGRLDRDPEGRGRPRHLSPLQPAARRADRRLWSRRGGQGRIPRSAKSGFRAAEIPARRHPLRRSLGRRERGLGRGRMGRRRKRSDSGRIRRRQQVAVQRGHRRQGARAADDRGPEGRGRRPARQDDHLRQEPRSRGFHRRALRRELSRISRDRSLA